MAYETGTTTSMSDLVATIDNFLTVVASPAWTQDQLDDADGEAAWSQGNQFISVRWNKTTPLHLGINHARGYTGGNLPGTHPGDDGSGVDTDVNAVLHDLRSVQDIGDGGTTSYHFFEDDDYFHAVLEISPGIYRHFGWGILDKTGDWVGGEYAYGHHQFTGTPNASTNLHLLDSFTGTGTNGNRGKSTATVYAELNGKVDNWPEAGTVWMTCNLGSASQARPDDLAGNQKAQCMGSSRTGLLPKAFGWLRSNLNNGFVPLIPIQLWYTHVPINPDELRFLGSMKDVRLCNIGGFDPKQEVTVGSDTWIMFPWSRKQFTPSSPPLDESRNGGFAYKKVTA